MNRRIKFPLYVTIDTNVFNANKYDFSQNSPLGLLKQYVASGKIKIVLSNIVIREVEKHIIEEGGKICKILRNSRSEILKTSSESFVEQLNLENYLMTLDKNDYRNKSKEIFKSYLDSINVEILNTNAIDLNSIIDDYFEIRPPFQVGEKKRKEFPDAFIANQIKKRFTPQEMVAIISDDIGFRKACGNSENHIFFNNLGELYNAINAQEAEYKTIVSVVSSKIHDYITVIESSIYNSNNVEIQGLSCDKDNNVHGFDYDEFEVVNVDKTICRIRTIDDINDNIVIATLLCNSCIEAECTYQDYNNAHWDKETDSYYSLDTKKNLEKHEAKFGIRIKYNRNDETIHIFPFKVILNSDTLKERIELNDNIYDYENDIINQERNELGLCSLDDYDNYMENNLAESDFHNSVISVFGEINGIYCDCEEISFVFDELLDILKSAEEISTIVTELKSRITDKSQLSLPDNIDKDLDSEKQLIIQWTEIICDTLSKIIDYNQLPDYFNFGDSIEIYTEKEKYIFSIDKLYLSPSEGEEEIVDINVKDSNGKVISTGYIKLTVGFFDYDEDGGIDNALNDSIEYFCDDIKDTLTNIYEEIRKYYLNLLELSNMIKEIIYDQNID